MLCLVRKEGTCGVVLDSCAEIACNTLSPDRAICNTTTSAGARAIENGSWEGPTIATPTRRVRILREIGCGLTRWAKTKKKGKTYTEGNERFDSGSRNPRVGVGESAPKLSAHRGDGQVNAIVCLALYGQMHRRSNGEKCKKRRPSSHHRSSAILWSLSCLGGRRWLYRSERAL
jgi:hypothetical protein